MTTGITSWSNFKMTNSFEDSDIERKRVQAKNINCNKKMRLQLWEYGLLGQWGLCHNHRAAVPLHLPRRTCRTYVSHPTPSMMDGSNVVYMMARAKFLHPKACVLAIGMEKIKRQGVSEFGIADESGSFSS
ncbi:hypothetical protein BS78_04G295000 [Paspalum vaginatum]|uniref:Uncharacterized protein n=1 Tax=Paspalum vaginatum TaxID=158149 RepID=A0A9W8CDG4_9POAL|nr:hypothetical protein BS78_K207100 [Paspalum vaginatum]KAJ1281285.1 hypothetical protein BS78_04G295000 [Paspalum vaginatum]